MPNHPTDGRIIFNAFQNGADASALISAFVIGISALLLVLVAWSFGKAYRRGSPVKSTRGSTTTLWNLIGRNSRLIIGITAIIALTGVIRFSLVFYSDWRRINNGDYSTYRGLIEGFTIVNIATNPQRLADRITDPEPALYETDQLVVGGLRFLLHCILNQSQHALTVGSKGRCIDLAVGDSVQIDYFPINETQYRSEPLIIRLLPRTD